MLSIIPLIIILLDPEKKVSLLIVVNNLDYQMNKHYNIYKKGTIRGKFYY